MYVGEFIFGNLLSSSNYNKKDKIVGGKNGIGAKLTNIYSKEFYIEIYDHNNKKLYKQTFRNNMYDKEEPVVCEATEGRAKHTLVGVMKLCLILHIIV